jgi:hypothetical protein
MRRKLSIVVAATMAAGGVFFVLSPPALAWRGPCVGTKVTAGPYQGYQGWCDGNGPDSYRAWAACYDTGAHVNYTRYGPWKWDGDRTQSTAWCAAYDAMVGGGL